MSLLNQTKYKIFYIPPKSIINCTKESEYCDYTQFSKNRSHPHAGNNRGVFEEDSDGLIKLAYSDWDKPGVKFEKLLEFIALKNHYNGKQKWRNSVFALRLKKYIAIVQKQKSFNKSDLSAKLAIYFKTLEPVKKSSKINELILKRENLIDILFDSILKNVVQPITKKKNFIDNISINVGEGGKIFFNNRGHHRLSIAKILNLKLVPVKITVAKSETILKNFIFKYEK
tara:strand:- start:62 stop:745 length:684 start_codon:yes stop_codon:yes gene_type:complete